MNTPIDFFSFFFKSIPLCELQKKYLPDNNVKLENFAQYFILSPLSVVIWQIILCMDGFKPIK